MSLKARQSFGAKNQGQVNGNRPEDDDVEMISVEDAENVQNFPPGKSAVLLNPLSGPGSLVNHSNTGSVKKGREPKNCHSILGNGKIIQDENGMNQQCSCFRKGRQLGTCDTSCVCSRACDVRNFGREALCERNHQDYFHCNHRCLANQRKSWPTACNAVSATRHEQSSKACQSGAANDVDPKSSTLPSSSRSSPKLQSEPSDGFGSVLCRMLENVDLEDNIVPLIKNLKKGTTTFQNVLESILHTVENEGNTKNDKAQLLFSFSDNTRVDRRRACGRMLKKGLETFLIYVKRILDNHNTSQSQPRPDLNCALPLTEPRFNGGLQSCHALKGDGSETPLSASSSVSSYSCSDKTSDECFKHKMNNSEERENRETETGDKMGREEEMVCEQQKKVMIKKKGKANDEEEEEQMEMEVKEESENVHVTQEKITGDEEAVCDNGVRTEDGETEKGKEETQSAASDKKGKEQENMRLEKSSKPAVSLSVNEDSDPDLHLVKKRGEEGPRNSEDHLNETPEKLPVPNAYSEDLNQCEENSCAKLELIKDMAEVCKESDSQKKAKEQVQSAGDDYCDEVTFYCDEVSVPEVPLVDVMDTNDSRGDSGLVGAQLHQATLSSEVSDMQVSTFLEISDADSDSNKKCEVSMRNCELKDSGDRAAERKGENSLAVGKEKGRAVKKEASEEENRIVKPKDISVYMVLSSSEDEDEHCTKRRQKVKKKRKKKKEDDDSSDSADTDNEGAVEHKEEADDCVREKTFANCKLVQDFAEEADDKTRVKSKIDEQEENVLDVCDSDEDLPEVPFSLDVMDITDNISESDSSSQPLFQSIAHCEQINTQLDLPNADQENGDKHENSNQVSGQEISLKKEDGKADGKDECSSSEKENNTEKREEEEAVQEECSVLKPGDASVRLILSSDEGEDEKWAKQVQGLKKTLKREKEDDISLKSSGAYIEETDGDEKDTHDSIKADLSDIAVLKVKQEPSEHFCRETKTEKISEKELKNTTDSSDTDDDLPEVPFDVDVENARNRKFEEGLDSKLFPWSAATGEELGQQVDTVVAPDADTDHSKKSMGSKLSCKRLLSLKKRDSGKYAIERKAGCIIAKPKEREMLRGTNIEAVKEETVAKLDKDVSSSSSTLISGTDKNGILPKQRWKEKKKWTGAVRKFKPEPMEDEDEDFNLLPVLVPKRLSNKILEDVISVSDSDTEISKTQQGLKRKRNPDARGFRSKKVRFNDDGGNNVYEISSDDDVYEDLIMGKQKGRQKDKPKKQTMLKKKCEEVEEPLSRKKIREIKSDSNLEGNTKAAAKAEEERRKRVQEKQTKFNGVETTEAGDGQAPITTKLVLEQKEDSEEPLIQVNPKLIRKLKPHQVEAVQFMWDCLFESLERSQKPEASGGCILAHCMGLGKTLSVIAFVHTLMTHRELTKVKTCLIVSPLNTVLNWQSEFKTWLGKENGLKVRELASVKENTARVSALNYWHSDGGIMIMGYEMFRNLSLGFRITDERQRAIFHKALVDPGPDLVVCDEGHLMKNSASALSKAMSQIKTRRRVVLTGTPLQNNLKEYHCMVDFVKPNLLGTKKEFANRFANPITNGQHSDSTGRDVRIMKKRAHVLHEVLAGCVHRRDYSALTKFLPPKQEYVISVRLSEMQITLYEEFLKRSGQVEGQITTRGAQLFKDYQNLMKIWTHPWMMKLSEIRDGNTTKLEDEDCFISGGDSGETLFSHDNISENGELNIAPDDTSSRMGASSGQRSKCLQEKDRTADAVKDWKRKSDGSDRDNCHTMTDTDPKAVSKQWWAEYVKEEDENKIEHSGKLVLLFHILHLCEEIGDKVLVFSQSLLSLNIIEHFLKQAGSKFRGNTSSKTENKEELGKQWIKGKDYFRLDGSTCAQMRQHWASIFNNPKNLRARLFLISTRAGGMGINLVGANRVIIFDASWNPSSDVQSIFRVYRFGQAKPCYVYRFLAQGTMEEKIYDRQVTKLSISRRVVDEHQIERHFSAADLSELYAFRPDRLSDDRQRETLMLPKDLLLAEIMSGEQCDWFVDLREHDSLLENLTEQELTEEEKKAAWEEYENEKKGLHMNASHETPNDTHLFSHVSRDFLQKTAQILREKNPAISDQVLQMHLQQIIMMQVRQRQENWRQVEMLKQQQGNQIMIMQQHHAPPQQHHTVEIGQHGRPMIPVIGPSHGPHLSSNPYIRMGALGAPIFHATPAAAAPSHSAPTERPEAASATVVEMTQ